MPSGWTGKREREVNDDGQEEQRAAKRTSPIKDFGSDVTILVGVPKQKFVLHKEALCAKSTYLRGLCVGGPQEGPILLPQIQPNHFAIYCSWVYFSELPGSVEAQHSDLDSSLECYILGEQLDDLQLRNRAIAKLSEGLCRLQPTLFPQSVSTFWARTIPGSILRSLLVDYTLQSAFRGNVVKELANWPSEFHTGSPGSFLWKASGNERQYRSTRRALYGRGTVGHDGLNVVHFICVERSG